jgi:hypothetical protein
VALPTSDQGWVTYLSQIHDTENKQLRLLNDEYELRAPRAYMHPEILREAGDRLQQVVIAWPQLVVDSLEERLDVEGFRLPDADESDDEMWRIRATSPVRPSRTRRCTCPTRRSSTSATAVPVPTTRSAATSTVLAWCRSRR